MRATGKTGVLCFKYQVAARLSDWSLEPVLILPRTQRFQLKGKVVSRHEPWSSRSPLDIRLEFGTNVWIWIGISVDMNHAVHELSIELHGPPTIEKGELLA
jgi:hypothetical protein